MRNVLIANPKGGSGKTTLSTNLAGYFASLGGHVVLSDLDRQQSATEWLQRRPAALPTIHHHQPRTQALPLGADWVISDSPAGFKQDKLSDAVKQADCILVPVQPSAFDMGATRHFLELLATEKAVRKSKTAVALVGIRVNSRSNASASLASFMQASNLPVLTYLRNAQIYASAAELGMSVFDMRPSLVAQDWAQWEPLLDWVVETTDNNMR